MVITLGLSKILGKTGEPANATATFTETGYTTFGLTYQDTAKMSQEDGEETEFYAEEIDDPVEVMGKEGKTIFNFSIMNPDLTTLKRLFGGEVASNVWAYPDASTQIEESLIILPRKGLKFSVPRAKIKAKLNGEFSKKGLLLVEVTATAMKPNTEGLKKLYVGLVNPK
ncbi:hypothetical protein E4T81_01675 [Barnesiella sp. WM24]|uniref:phage tail tube protein n=1 Tax=Barnesiella sp. WM24 TaxID=2558278 RepID=UPI001072405C|nr:hypothetical protein [Barnesiella sp. WM24]TFU95263.1 hypothetical protein E4T81_01675 [Barnesiella sp. WM24]